MTLRELRTGKRLTVSLSTDEGRPVTQSAELGVVVLDQVLATHRITGANDAEWAQLAAFGYPVFLKVDALDNLGPMGEFARKIAVSCAGARIREADWSWEDPVLEIWWRGLRIVASFHEIGPHLECSVGNARKFAYCSWSTDVAGCFRNFADDVIGESTRQP